MLARLPETAAIKYASPYATEPYNLSTSGPVAAIAHMLKSR